MSQKFNLLLLAALQRASKPMTSEDLIDQAVGLALSVGWTTEQLEGLNRHSISARLRHLESEGLLKVGGAKSDRNRRTIPAYEPARRSQTLVDVPKPPSPVLDDEPSPYDSMTRSQIMTLLEVHDEYLGVMSRMMSEMRDINVRARRRLSQAGLEFGK